MQNKMNQNSKMVRFFDGATKSYHMIPASELTSDMISFKEAGSSEEPAWAHMSEFTVSNKFLPPEFNKRIKGLIRMIQTDVAEVYYLTEKQWEDGFRMDVNPEKEISRWVIIGETYQDAVTNEVYTQEQKRDLFKIILSSSSGENVDAIYCVTDPKSFSREQAFMLIKRSIARRKLFIEELRKRKQV